MKDGMTWLLNSPEQSLALILADHGYDVWIANTRGTSFSRRHVSLDPDKPVCTIQTLFIFVASCMIIIYISFNC